MDRRLAGAAHHGLPDCHLTGLALHQHLPGLLAHHGDLLTHHLPGLLSSHHLPLHHRPHLLAHHLGLLLPHHLPGLLLQLLLLRHDLPHHLARHNLHLPARRSHLHAGTRGSHEPPLHHLHVLSRDWRPHTDHVWLW